MQQLGLAGELWQIVGDDVLVLHRQDRQLEADHAPDLARPKSAGVDDVLGMHVAVLGDHVPTAVGALFEIDHAILANDFGAADLRGLGVGVGDAIRIDVTFDGVVDRTDEMFLVEQRKALFGFGHVDQFEIHAEIAPARHGHLQPVEPLRRAGEHQSARDVQTAGLTRDLLELAVQIDGVLLQLRDVRVAVDGVHAACGVPGRTRGEFGSFDQHDVAPAGLGQVIKHADADHATADHDYFCLIFHDLRFRCFVCCDQLTGGAPPSAVRRATKSLRASTIAGSRGGGW